MHRAKTTMQRIAILIAIAAFILPLAPITAQQAAPLLLSSTDENRIIPVRVGQMFLVTLHQAGGTGSSWRMVPDAGLAQIGPATVILLEPSKPLGKVARSFKIMPKTAGEFTLTFVNERSFGGSYQQAETATFVLEVK